jgi:N-acyl homoserine lactone hydrolase
MKMHVLSGGRLRVRKTMYDADAVRGETMDVPVSCILLRHSQGNVLFDTGCHPTVAENAEAHWGGLAKVMAPVMRPGDNVINALAGVGLQCDDIDVVVCSHLHPDHCGCNTFFKHATFVIHAKELAAARAPGAEKAGYLAAEWEQSAPTDTIDGERDLFGDGRIVVNPAARSYAGLERGAGRARKVRNVPAGRRHRQPARDARYRLHSPQYLERRRAR